VTKDHFDSPVRGVVVSAHQAASRLLKSSFSLFTPVRGVFLKPSLREGQNL
jgi:hypothetical protein